MDNNKNFQNQPSSKKSKKKSHGSQPNQGSEQGSRPLEGRWGHDANEGNQSSQHGSQRDQF